MGGTCPISESFYKLWDQENDARWIHFYSSCTPLLMASGVLSRQIRILMKTISVMKNGNGETGIYTVIRVSPVIRLSV